MPSGSDSTTFANTTLDTSAGSADPGSHGHLGRYRLDRMIGHGAMGAVFEAFDATLGRTLAIKTLYTHVDESEGGFNKGMVDAAILKEARAAATLNHPHIVTVYDAGRAPSTVLMRELPYVAMELLQGQDLKQRIQQGPRMGQREAVSLVGKLALALDHAHKSGVLHRDIKPANVFITKNGSPKILDFGLAQISNRTIHTEAHKDDEVIAGSPQYMSPELVRSMTEADVTVDVRSDVYSLGVILYELLCGKPPFSAPTLELLQERIRHAPAEAPHTLNSSVPKDLSLLVLRALAKKPEDRFRSAAQMARELRRWGAVSGVHDHDGSDAMAESRPAKLSADNGHASTNPFNPNASAPPFQRKGKAVNTRLIAIGLAAAIGLGIVLWKWVLPLLGTPHTNDTLSANESLVHDAKPAQAASAALPAAATAPTAPPAQAPSPLASPAGAAASAAAPSAATGASAPAPTLAPIAAPVAAPAAEPVVAPAATPAQASNTATNDITTEAADTPNTSVLNTGNVRLLVTPWGQVTVDGKDMGVSPPLTTMTLPVGTHQIVVRNTDFAAKTFSIKVNAGKTARLTHRFE
jgi:eukaryotic-like serine/threonine-protein kinase